MDVIVKKLVELLKKAPKGLKITLIGLIAILLAMFGYLFVSCGSLSLDALDWQYGNGVYPPVSGTPIDITE